MTLLTKEAPIAQGSSKGIYPASPRWTARDVIILLLLGVVFFILERPTFHDPYYWDSTIPADMAHRMLDAHLSPILKNFPDPGHPPLIAEIYAVGWFVLGRTPVWWPHTAAFLLCFLIIAYSYRIGVWLGGTAVGLVAAALITMDPLLLAQSGVIYLTAPSVGFATAALYYLLTKQPRKFALAGSLAALAYIPTFIFICCLIGIACLREIRRGLRAILWYLVPGFVFTAWLIVHRIGYGYFLSDPSFWKIQQRSTSLDPVHLKINLLEVFCHTWRLPFTIVTICGGIALLVLWRMSRRSAPNPANARWYEQLGGDRALALLFVLIVGTIIYLPVITATSGLILLGRYLMVLMVPLFLLTVRFLRASRSTWLWLLICAGLGWMLHAHWYDPKDIWKRNLEETLLYRRLIRLDVRASNYVVNTFPSATVLAAFPLWAAVSNPVWEYVQHGVKVEKALESTPQFPVDIICYSSINSPEEQQQLFDAIEAQGARPIRTFEDGNLRDVVLKTGDNLNVPNDRYTGLLIQTPLVVQPGELFELHAAFQNLGRNVWAAPKIPWEITGDVNVGYRWEQNGQILPEAHNSRWGFPRDVFWGEGAVVKLLVVAPRQPGDYTLVLDLVGKAGNWYAADGNTPVRVQIQVR